MRHSFYNLSGNKCGTFPGYNFQKVDYKENQIHSKKISDVIWNNAHSVVDEK